MNQESLVDLLYVAAFFVGGLGFAIAPFIAAHLLAARSTRNTRQKTKQLVECGVPPIGDAWVRYGIVYYIYALMFVAFTVNILFLFPVVLVYDQDFHQVGSWRAFLMLLIFVGILSLAIIYAWKKGDFEWKHKIYNLR